MMQDIQFCILQREIKEGFFLCFANNRWETFLILVEEMRDTKNFNGKKKMLFCLGGEVWN
jgi:hypothetical protein